MRTNLIESFAEESIIMRQFIILLLAIATAQPVLAATLRVPQDHKTLQAAIDASSLGDTILVAPGKYQERIRLKPGITLRSVGDDAKEADGLKRAEATIIDGGKEGKHPSSAGTGPASRGKGCPRRSPCRSGSACRRAKSGSTSCDARLPVPIESRVLGVAAFGFLSAFDYARMFDYDGDNPHRFACCASDGFASCAPAGAGNRRRERRQGNRFAVRQLIFLMYSDYLNCATGTASGRERFFQSL